MKERKLSQDLLPLRSELDDDAPPIDVVAQACDQTSLHQPINQLNRTMMLKLEPLGHLTDRCFPPGRQSLEPLLLNWGVVWPKNSPSARRE